MDKLIVTILGILAAIFTFWFFLAKRGKEIVVTDAADSTGSLQVDILVEGGYTPGTIVIPHGKKTVINFIRKDTSSCLEEVVLGDFKIRKYLPLNQKVAVELIPQKVGEFGYACGMNMYHGKIIVR